MRWLLGVRLRGTRPRGHEGSGDVTKDKIYWVYIHSRQHHRRHPLYSASQAISSGECTTIEQGKYQASPRGITSTVWCISSNSATLKMRSAVKSDSRNGTEAGKFG